MKRILPVAVLAALIGTAVEAADVKVEKIEVRLFYELSGRLSDNVAPPADVSLWNTVIGEGSAEEPASDVLVTITVMGEPGSYLEGKPLIVHAKASNEYRTVQVDRQFDGLMFPTSGRIVKAVWLQDVTCLPLDIVATIDGAEAKNRVEFNCGE